MTTPTNTDDFFDDEDTPTNTDDFFGISSFSKRAQNSVLAFPNTVMHLPSTLRNLEFTRGLFNPTMPNFDEGVKSWTGLWIQAISILKKPLAPTSRLRRYWDFLVVADILFLCVTGMYTILFFVFWYSCTPMLFSSVFHFIR